MHLIKTKETKVLSALYSLQQMTWLSKSTEGLKDHNTSWAGWLLCIGLQGNTKKVSGGWSQVPY